VRRSKGVTRTFVAIVLAAAVCATAGATLTQAATRPLVVVVRHGGLCVTGTECRSVLRITETTISGDGYRPRRLDPTERRSLIRAIGGLDAAYLRRHPFTGTCPIAYDGQESIYRFRGFVPSIPSCKYDVRGIRAVRLTERLLGTLKPR
jgi:hypothetical protein